MCTGDEGHGAFAAITSGVRSDSYLSTVRQSESLPAKSQSFYLPALPKLAAD